MPCSWCGAVANRKPVVALHPRRRASGLPGPTQRIRRLGTVHLDVTPGPVSVRALDRDVDEGLAIVEAQAERARAARQAAGPSAGWRHRRSPRVLRVPPQRRPPDQSPR